MQQTFGQDFGRLFEVGFNTGLIAAIAQLNIPHHVGDRYTNELANLTLGQLVDALVLRERVVNSVDRRIVEQWTIFYVLKGFFSGLHFLREYHDSLGREGIRDVVYLQCRFTGDNSLQTAPVNDQDAWATTLQQLISDDLISTIDRYRQRGEFLNADTLLLLKCRTHMRILAIDLSIFFVASAGKLADFEDIETLRSLLLVELNYVRTKSVFAELSIDAGPLSLPLPEDMARYFKAFVRQDKESMKLIQAGSYAFSFYHFLQTRRLLPDDLPIIINAVGYSDRGVSTMTIRKDQLDVLKTCQEIYTRQVQDQEVSAARDHVVRSIAAQATRAFGEGGRDFITTLLNGPYDTGSTLTPIVYRERISGFVNSIDQVAPELLAALGLPATLNVRDAHAALILRALQPAASAPYLFLTGNPGIGKTTAVVRFLLEHVDEGFLFLYVSPRTQVNLDIIEKLLDPEGAVRDNRILTLTTTAPLIARYNGSPTVQYHYNHWEGEKRAHGVRFVNAHDPHAALSVRRSSIQRADETRLTADDQRRAGVLASICQALGATVQDDLARCVVAAISIQSLKVTPQGRSTLEHIRHIFASAYNNNQGTVIPEKLKHISQRMRHLIIMVDEISGDESGAAFLDGIRRMLVTYDLFNPEHGFNTKVIVADASIVDPQVITQHLETTATERDKIFFRTDATPEPALSSAPFRFNNYPAVVINANTYPAAALSIGYNVVVEAASYRPETLVRRPQSMENQIQDEVFHDVLRLVRQPDSGQIIVYMQDKRRLAALVNRLRLVWKREGWGDFVEQIDYVAIHADLTEQQKGAVAACKQTVPLVFMTASASRGLSFPMTRHLLVVVPQFAIEHNLMEILQVIYRGRGDPTQDAKDKELTFYIGERAFYDAAASADERRLAIQERVLHLINALLILKTAIMTRIQGYGVVGRDRWRIIPLVARLQL